MKIRALWLVCHFQGRLCVIPTSVTVRYLDCLLIQGLNFCGALNCYVAFCVCCPSEEHRSETRCSSADATVGSVSSFYASSCSLSAAREHSTKLLLGSLRVQGPNCAEHSALTRLSFSALCRCSCLCKSAMMVLSCSQRCSSDLSRPTHIVQLVSLFSCGALFASCARWCAQPMGQSGCKADCFLPTALRNLGHRQEICIGSAQVRGHVSPALFLALVAGCLMSSCSLA